MEEAHRELDVQLAVSRWRTHWSQPEPGADDRDPTAPVWWVDEEEASASFLEAMGVMPQMLAEG